MSQPGFPDDGRTDGMRGVAAAIVTDNEDPEGLGRVKVEYPWRESGDESYWARIAVPMAGPDRGTYFLPEVDDEVLVAFDDGDIDHPYVLGMLWNGRDAPPEDNADGDNDVRTVKSRSGHELTFDDGDRDGKVEITTAAGHEIVLDDASGSEKITIADKSGQNEITFDAVSGSLDITSGAKLTIEATSIEISGDGNVSIESSGMIKLKGSLIKLN